MSVDLDSGHCRCRCREFERGGLSVTVNILRAVVLGADLKIKGGLSCVGIPHEKGFLNRSISRIVIKGLHNGDSEGP